ncbi:MAG TPA: hypothetical protein VLX92_18745 [Kofleriaceae bacterium]|nr:hypothetical protein [Kofleriaceae bacterium]
MREVLVHADRLRLELLHVAMLAHELRASLAAIGLVLELRAIDAPEDPDLAYALRHCRDAGDGLHACLARIRDIPLGAVLDIDRLLAPFTRRRAPRRRG